MSSDLLSKIEGVPFDKNINISTCGTCAQAKQCRNSYCDDCKKATRTLELIHTDTVGSRTPSVNNENYILSFLDDFSCYSVVFCIKNRNDVFKCFVEFENRATVKFNVKIHKLRCDNALEFVTSEMKRFCVEKCFVIQPSEPYLHEHNGKIERWNRTFVEKARSLLYDAKMPVTYWSYAVYTVTYLLNQLSTSALNFRTSFQLWNGVKPNYKYLTVFGCVAQTLIPYEKRRKLEPKSHLL